MAEVTRLRSTDRDLLVFQRVLGVIRWPKKGTLMAEEIEKRKVRLRRRFLAVNHGDGILRLTQKNPTKRLALYEMGVSFQVNNVPYKDMWYRVRVDIVAPQIPGYGMTKAACLDDAKETFRKLIAAGLRTVNSDVRVEFFKNVRICYMNGVPVQDKDVFHAVAEKFRVWAGNNIREVDGDIRNRFADAVRSNEVRILRESPRS